MPHSPAPSIDARVAAAARWSADGSLEVHWRIEGALDGLRVPPPGEPGPGEELWRHTCFEAFVRGRGGPGYVELNVAPSSRWAIYRFRAYREREDETAAGSAVAPHVAVAVAAGRIEAWAVLPAIALPPGGAAAGLDVGLSAVLEGRDGAMSYRALRHPPGRPDFHHAEAFALRLAPRGAA